MSQFYGYTVDLELKNPPGKTIRGIIDKINDKKIVLKNPFIVKSDGSYDKLNKSELSINTNEISDLSVIELAKNTKNNNNNNNNNNKNKKQSKISKKENNKDKDKSKDSKSSSDSESNSSNTNNKLHLRNKSDSKKELEVKYVDIYNEKPNSNLINNVNKKNNNNNLEEFDFASNLQKFDKESVFKDISKHDKIDQAARLVSFNKAENKDKYSNDEMILKKKENNNWDNNLNFDYSNIINKDNESNKSELSDISNNNNNNNDNSNSQIKNVSTTTTFERKLSINPTFAPQFFSSSYDDFPIPTISTLQLSEVFNIVKDKFSFTEQILIENSGRSLSELIINNIIGSFRIGFKNHNEPPIVLLLIGNNRTGSITLNTGRHIFNRGLKTIAFLLYDKDESDDELLPQVDEELKRYSNIGGKIINSLSQLEKLLKMIDSPLEFILDGLQGFDSDINDLLDSEILQATKLIEWCNESGLPMMSIDIPTGLSASSGTNENDNTLLIKSKYLVSIGLPLSSALNMYKFGYYEKGKVIHYLVDCGLPRRVFSTKGSLRKFDRRWFADSGCIDMKVVN